MTTSLMGAVVTQSISPAVQRARDAIDLPEVQQILKRLADFNLGIYVPHVHLPHLDFGPLPPGQVQIEQGLRVRWASREEADALPNAVEVAWRWTNDGVTCSADCTATCSTNPDEPHYHDHLKDDD